MSKNCVVKYESYESNREEVKSRLVEDTSSVTFSYDGGRLYIYVGGKEVYETFLAGNSFYVDIEMKEN